MACAWLMGCGNDTITRQAGGFGSETTNGVWVSGVAGPGMPVAARMLDGDSRAVSAVADSDGFWSMQLPVGAWAVSGQINQSGFLQHLRVDSGDDSLTMDPVGVTPLVSFEGRFTGSNGDEFAELPDLGREVRVQSNGSFRFDRVPQGALVLRARRNGVVAGEYLAFTGKADSFPTAHRSLMLENFDDGDDFNSLAGYLNNTEWYSWPGLENGRKTIPALETDDRVAKLLKDTVGVWSGKSLHVQVIPNSANSIEAAFMMALGSRGAGNQTEGRVDLSGSDSLVFMAKGTGKIRVDLWAYWSATDDRANLSSHDIGLSPNWVRVALAWKDLKLESSQKMIGDDFKKIRVNRIRFQVYEADLWLDDIQIPGASPLLLLQ